MKHYKKSKRIVFVEFKIAKLSCAKVKLY